MIFALLNPVSLVGSLLGFGGAMVLRGMVQRAVSARTGGWREPLWNPRHDFDVFGIIAAVIGGMGWGGRAPSAGFGKPSIAVLLSGPLAVIAASQALLAGYVATGGQYLSTYSGMGWIVLQHGALTEGSLPQFLVSAGIAMLYAGVLALVPLPPLDGWGLLERRFGRRPGENFAKAQLWLVEKNLGVVILLAGLVIPPGSRTLFLFLLDVITIPVFMLWAALTGAA